MVIKLTEMTKKGNLVFLRHLCNDIFSCHIRKSSSAIGVIKYTMQNR